MCTLSDFERNKDINLNELEKQYMCGKIHGLQEAWKNFLQLI